MWATRQVLAEPRLLKVTARAGDQLFYQELEPTRGFQSSSDFVLTFGVGRRDTLDSVTVEWPDHRTSTLRRVAGEAPVVARTAPATLEPAPLARCCARSSTDRASDYGSEG